MDLKKKRISFIGAGKMAEALIKGLSAGGAVSARNICASDIIPSRLNELRRKYGIRVSTNNSDVIKGADVIVLAVKPQIMKEVLSTAGRLIKPKQLVISIAAGISIASIRKAVKRSPVVRVMPNNPAMIGKGISAIAKGSGVTKVHLNIVQAIFSSVGDVVNVAENLMDAVTALSGSGPAFVYLFAEAMTAGGVASGLDQKTSATLAVKTLLGAALTLDRSEISPGELIKMVCSPKGTTLAGMKVLENKRIKAAVIDAVKAASKRAGELGRIFNP